MTGPEGYNSQATLGPRLGYLPNSYILWLLPCSHTTVLRHLTHPVTVIFYFIQKPQWLTREQRAVRCARMQATSPKTVHQSEKKKRKFWYVLVLQVGSTQPRQDTAGLSEGTGAKSSWNRHFRLFGNLEDNNIVYNYLMNWKDKNAQHNYTRHVLYL